MYTGPCVTCTFVGHKVQHNGHVEAPAPKPPLPPRTKPSDSRHGCKCRYDVCRNMEPHYHKCCVAYALDGTKLREMCHA